MFDMKCRSLSREAQYGHFQMTFPYTTELLKYARIHAFAQCGSPPKNERLYEKCLMLAAAMMYMVFSCKARSSLPKPQN